MKAGVSVGVVSQFATVAVYGRVPVHSVELDADAFSLPLRGRAEGLAIPTNARRVEPAARARRIVLGGAPFDAPIVRKVYAAPAGVVKGARLSAARIAEEEFPV